VVHDTEESGGKKESVNNEDQADFNRSSQRISTQKEKRGVG